MKEKRFTLRALIITAVLTLVLTLGGVALTAWLRLGPGGLAVLQSMDLIDSRFPGVYDPAQTAPDAIRGMVEGLDDRWSVYLTKEQYENWRLRQQNAYIGVGLTYTETEDHTAIEIKELTPGGPADKAGLQVGEFITAIDGQALSEDNLADLVATLQAEDGKEHTFTVLGTDGSTRQVRVRAGRVETVSVTWGLSEDGIGYVRLSNFYAGSADETKAAVEALIEEGAKALLFDVRSNPGGYADELIRLLDYLLPEGPIFAERSKSGPVYTHQSDEACVELPMAALVNADSYSAAEMFAAQLRESVNAPIIGEPTCGKGYYQQTFPLIDGSALNLSTGLYTTGGGVSLIGTGVVPDIVEEDIVTQMELALECLKEKLG